MDYDVAQETFDKTFITTRFRPEKTSRFFLGKTYGQVTVIKMNNNKLTRVSTSPSI